MGIISKEQTMQKSDPCEKCTKLKWQLAAHSKEHEATTPTQKHQCQEASSWYPFEYLSPQSKTVKVENLRRTVISLHRHARTVTQNIERSPVSDIQNGKISELVHSIHNSE